MPTYAATLQGSAGTGLLVRGGSAVGADEAVAAGAIALLGNAAGRPGAPRRPSRAVRHRSRDGCPVGRDSRFPAQQMAFQQQAFLRSRP